MSVTLTGAALIIYGLFASMFAPARLMQAMVLFGSFSATAVVNFSNYGMSPCAAFFPMYLGWKVMSGDVRRPVPVGRDHLLILVLLVCFLTISVVSLLMNKATRDVVAFQTTQTAYAGFGILLTLIMSIDFCHESRLEMAVSALRCGAVFIAIWGIVQAACYYAHVPYPAELFNNTSSHSNDMFDQRAAGGAIIRIASVAVEPSFMAVSLLMFGAFGATLLVIEPRFRSRSWIISVGLVILVTAASTSSTAYLGMAMLALLLGLQRPGMMIAFVLVVGIIAASALAAFPTFQAALFEMTVGKSTGGSYAERSQTVVMAIQMIPEKPWIGWGWGGVITYSMATQLLTNVGGLGTACFTLAIIGTVTASQAARRAACGPDDWRLRSYAKGMENAMIVFITQSLAVGLHFVVADFWLFWALALAIPSCLGSSHLRQRSSAPHRQGAILNGLST